MRRVRGSVSPDDDDDAEDTASSGKEDARKRPHDAEGSQSSTAADAEKLMPRPKWKYSVCCPGADGSRRQAIRLVPSGTGEQGIISEICSMNGQWICEWLPQLARFALGRGDGFDGVSKAPEKRPANWPCLRQHAPAATQGGRGALLYFEHV